MVSSCNVSHIPTYSQQTDETRNKPVTLLVLGAGWTSTFLIPLLKEESITYAATSTTGREGTIEFKFEPESEDAAPYRALPIAATILITFPLTGTGQSKRLVDLYKQTHPSASPNFIQFGSSGIWQVAEQDSWVTRHSRYETSGARAVAEDELLALGGCVLNLSGLWGGERHPRNWVDRVAKTKEAVAGKTSLHLIHGEDVARAVVAVMGNFPSGQRWMLTDMFVYDWWALIMGWADNFVESDDGRKVSPKQVDWVRELMNEKDVRALPRSMETLGRCYDTREFWTTFGLTPIKGRAK